MPPQTALTPGDSPNTPDSHGPFGRVVATGDPAAHDRHDGEFNDGLASFLTGFVPIVIAEMRTWSPEHLERTRIETADMIAAHGDDLQYGGKHATEARIALAKALAIGARAEGGITALGVHACLRPHEGCPGTFGGSAAAGFAA